MANRMTGYKQARVTAVVPTEHFLGGFKPGYVQAVTTHGNEAHNFVDGSINAAPESLHRVGAKCWLGWMRSASHNLPVIKERD